jgi:PKD repeat protein
MDVTVNAASSVDFIAAPNPPSGPPGLTVTFADNSSSGGTSWLWNFGAGQGTATHPDNQSVTHTYNTVGDYTVSLTVTYPSPTGNVTATKTGFVHVGAAQCTAPFLNGIHRNSAPAAWAFAGFTGLVTDAPGAPNGNFIITAQAPTGGQLVPCTSGVVVNRP